MNQSNILFDPDAPIYQLPDYFQDTEVDKAMKLAVRCATWNTERLVGLTIGGETPVHVATTAFGLTHEHHGAFLNLLMDGRLGSALAMLRPCFESLIRGLWLIRGCNSAQYQHFEAGNDTKTVEQLLGDIKRRSSDPEDAFLQETWELSKRSLHQYTHITFQLLVRRMDEELLESPPPRTELADAIRFATGTAMLASVEIAKLVESTALEKEALRFLTMLYPQSKDASETGQA